MTLAEMDVSVDVAVTVELTGENEKIVTTLLKDIELGEQLYTWEYPESTVESRALASVACRDAAGLIKRYGWAQHTYGDRAYGLCCMGALQESLSELVKTSDDWNKAYLEIRSTLWNQHKIANVPNWNDALPVATGKETVVNTLNAVADHLSR